MLIDFNRILQILYLNNIRIKGALHIGAHACEELSFYLRLGLLPTSIVWIDAIKQKVIEAQNNNIPNVYHATITDKDDENVTFHIANNFQSSSVLELGTHTTLHPDVVYTENVVQQTTTIDTFYKRNQLNASNYNFWNFDIQGAELMALKGATESIQYADAIYLEVNSEHVYKDCGLINEIDEFLSKYNFERVLTQMWCNSWGDAFYIRKK
jgi:FkbM family methyltransferase